MLRISLLVAKQAVVTGLRHLLALLRAVLQVALVTTCYGLQIYFIAVCVRQYYVWFASEAPGILFWGF